MHPSGLEKSQPGQNKIPGEVILLRKLSEDMGEIQSITHAHPANWQGLVFQAGETENRRKNNEYPKHIPRRSEEGN